MQDIALVTARKLVHMAKTLGEYLGFINSKRSVLLALTSEMTY